MPEGDSTPVLALAGRENVELRNGGALNLDRLPREYVHHAGRGIHAKDAVRGVAVDNVGVTQVELSRRYGAPESRVGAVLARLREESLVRRNPGRGWTFQPAINTPEALAQSYALRLAVEPAGLRQAELLIDSAALDLSRRRHEQLLARAAQGPFIRAQVFEVDSSFHEMLSGFSGNPYFLEAVQTQNRVRRIVEFVEYSDFARIEVWCVEHMGILDALALDDADRAADLLTAHLTRASKSVGRR